MTQGTISELLNTAFFQGNIFDTNIRSIESSGFVCGLERKQWLLDPS
jgi:hypothetical protein